MNISEGDQSLILRCPNNISIITILGYFSADHLMIQALAFLYVHCSTGQFTTGFINKTGPFFVIWLDIRPKGR